MLDAVYAGVDAESFSGRLDFHDGLPDGRYQIIVNIEVTPDVKERDSAVSSYRLVVDAQGASVLSWVLTNGDARNVLARVGSNHGHGDSNRVEVAIGEIFEMLIPFEVVGARRGSRIRLRFTVWVDQLPTDALPLEGWIDLYALVEEEVESNLFTHSRE